MLGINLNSELCHRLLGYYFINPKAKRHLRGLAETIEVDPSNLSRVLQKLVKLGLFEVEILGRAKLFSLNPKCPFYKELRNLVLKVQGVEKSLRLMVEETPGVKEAFLFGSFARGEADEWSDIDVLLIGDPDFTILSEQVEKVEKRLGREVNYVILTTYELRQRKRNKDAFIEDIFREKYVVLK